MPEFVDHLQIQCKVQMFWPCQFEKCTLMIFKSKPWLNQTTINGLLTPNIKHDTFPPCLHP